MVTSIATVLCLKDVLLQTYLLSIQTFSCGRSANNSALAVIATRILEARRIKSWSLCPFVFERVELVSNRIERLCSIDPLVLVGAILGVLLLLLLRLLWSQDPLFLQRGFQPFQLRGRHDVVLNVEGSKFLNSWQF